VPGWLIFFKDIKSIETPKKTMPGSLKKYQMIQAFFVTTQSLHYMVFQEEEG